MKSSRKPIEKLTIDEAASEKLSDKIIHAVDKINFEIEVGNPKSFYVHITRKGFELKGTWGKTIAGIVGVIGLFKFLS